MAAAMDALALQAIRDGDDDEIRVILTEVCALTNMAFAAVARVTDDRWIACQVLDNIGFGLAPGSEVEVQKTICNEIREHARAVVFDDAIEDPTWETHPVPIFYGFRSYASFPVFLMDGSFFGTLCAIDPEPRHLSSKEVHATLRDCANRVSTILSGKISV
jgi:GAF domain-containing protein